MPSAVSSHEELDIALSGEGRLTGVVMEKKSDFLRCMSGNRRKVSQQSQRLMGQTLAEHGQVHCGTHQPGMLCCIEGCVHRLPSAHVNILWPTRSPRQ